MSVVLLPAIGALLVLALDLGTRSGPPEARAHRANALSGIRLGSVAMLCLAAVLAFLQNVVPTTIEGGIELDDFAVFGIVFLVIAGVGVLSLSLTHFGMARSRPAEPIALLLFSISGMATAIAAGHLLILMIALELAWLPLIALIAIDSRRLSSSESSLKAFFAHAFASLVFAWGVAFVFGATGRLDLAALAGVDVARPLFFQVGVTLVIVGLIARGAVAPFHPWSPDVYEGAPSFVTAHVATVAQTTTFLVLLRMMHALAPADADLSHDISARVPDLLAVLGCLGLAWGHAMALVQVGLRRLVGWLGVGQAGFFTLALVEARAEGGEALLLALFASAVAVMGVLATLGSLSHHERACEQVGDLSGMMQRSPIRAALLALFFLSLVGFPGTVGFVARVELLGALEQTGHRWLVLAGLAATVLALIAIGRPLLAMLRPTETKREPSRALTNEQFVLVLCGMSVVYFGIAPLLGGGHLSGLLTDWIAAALASLRA
jgi:NADH-quinone oxidoreductase subunit N